MKKPVLVVMAAGMGSRYGGLKQIDPVDKEGHIIMDFSIYDAVQAGFQKVVFIIKKENEADFRSAIGDRLSNQLEVSYVFQDLHNIPEGYEVPEGRVKPWGTGHAVLSCINEIDGPFVVINADDYYGSHAFKMAYDFLTENEDTADTYRYMMVGYKLENTLTENGHVARGVCVTDEEGHLRGEKRHSHHRSATHGRPHRAGVFVRRGFRESGQERAVRRHQEAGAGSHQGRGAALRSVLYQFPLARRHADQLQDHPFENRPSQ